MYTLYNEVNKYSILYMQVEHVYVPTATYNQYLNFGLPTRLYGILLLILFRKVNILHAHFV